MTDSDPDNSYRPRSPDISSLQTSYAHQSYVDPYTQQLGYSPLNHPTTPQASYDASPFFNRQQYFPPQPLHQPYHYDSYQSPEMPPTTRSRAARAQSYAQENESHYAPTHHTHPPQLSHPQPPHQPQQHPPPTPDSRQEPATKVAKKNLDDPSGSPPAAGSGPSQGIEIKTKFPVARIKRIMQADEDVGKVAQVTPVAVSKALELFMITLVTKAAEQAKARSSKRITATHLKEAVLKDEHFDFLHEIMSKVPDQQAKKDDDGSDHNDGRKRRGGGGGRRKKDDHGDE